MKNDSGKCYVYESFKASQRGCGALNFTNPERLRKAGEFRKGFWVVNFTNPERLRKAGGVVAGMGFVSYLSHDNPIIIFLLKHNVLLVFLVAGSTVSDRAEKRIWRDFE